jgi:hypothetical protein
MKAYRKFLVRLEKPVHEEGSTADAAASHGARHRLQIAVVFTSLSSTVAALNRAASLLRGLDGRISLIDARPIPYVLPLNEPPVSLDFTQLCLRAIASASDAEEVTPQIVLCRFRFEALVNVLKPYSLIIIGCRKSRWPNREKRLARKLRRRGYEVLVRED